MYEEGCMKKEEKKLNNPIIEAKKRKKCQCIVLTKKKCQCIVELEGSICFV